MAEVGSLLGTAENLTNLWRARICKILRQKCRICKFLHQNFVFVNFCNKNVTFSNTRYPKIPDYSENISGRVRVLLKIIGSGIGYPSDTEHQAVWCKSFPLCKRNECYEADRRKQLPADPRLATVPPSNTQDSSTYSYTPALPHSPQLAPGPRDRSQRRVPTT